MARTAFNLRRVAAALAGALAGLVGGLWFSAFVLVDQDFTDDRTIRLYAAILIAAILIGSAVGAITSHRRPVDAP
jgi:ABC-type branched-subunit amino acid transport system permease subunit